MEQLCTDLESKGLIRSSKVISAFRIVDKGKFLPKELSGDAYCSQKVVKVKNFHQSAPYIYASALESMKLKEGNSFLNIGSGTGYLSALVAACIGPNAVNDGVELCEELVRHAIYSYQAFRDTLEETDRKKFGDIHFFCGNALQINHCEFMSYDRIYVGAGCSREQQEFFQRLLSNDGILYGPFEGQMLTICRVDEDVFSVCEGSFERFLPLLTNVNAPITIPKDSKLDGQHPSRTIKNEKFQTNQITSEKMKPECAGCDATTNLDIQMQKMQMHVQDMVGTLSKLISEREEEKQRVEVVTNQAEWAEIRVINAERALQIAKSETHLAEIRAAQAEEALQTAERAQIRAVQAQNELNVAKLLAEKRALLAEEALKKK